MKTEEIFQEIELLEEAFYVKIQKLFSPKQNPFSLGFGDETKNHGVAPWVLSLRGDWRIVQLLDFYSMPEVHGLLLEIKEYDREVSKSNKSIPRIFSMRGKKVFVESKRGEGLDELMKRFFQTLVSGREEDGIFSPVLLMNKLDETRIFFYSPKIGEFERMKCFDE